MAPVVFGRHSADPGRRAASLNVVAITVLLIVLAPGAVASVLTWNPFPLIAAAVIGIVLMQSPRQILSSRPDWRFAQRLKSERNKMSLSEPSGSYTLRPG